MKAGQHPNNAIGNAIGEAKHDLMGNVKAGMPVAIAVEQFIFAVSYALREIVKNLKSEDVAN